MTRLRLRVHDRSTGVSTMHALVRVSPLISAALSINFHQSVSNFLQSITFRPDTIRAYLLTLLLWDSFYLYIKLMVGEAISFGNTVSRNKVIAPRIAPLHLSSLPKSPLRSLPCRKFHLTPEVRASRIRGFRFAATE